MPTYVFLVKWTDQGVKNVKDTVKRMRDVKALTERHGGKVLSSYWTQGAYDLIVTIEATDEITASADALTIASGGHVAIQTLRAFTEPEMEQIIQKMS